VIELSPNIAAALIAGAQEEGREELAELWARLLASAMDPATRDIVSFSFIVTAKEMNPVDVLVIQHIHENNLSVVRVMQTGNVANRTVGVAQIADKLGRRSDEVETSLRHLNQLLLLDEVEVGKASFSVNAVCRKFLRACYPEVPASR
jgi:Abortive infection alpha